MPTAALSRRQAQVREATPSDEPALQAIAAACPMEGRIALCMTREPDFFALNKLEGERWKLGVAEVSSEVVGCVMIAERRTYLHGLPATTFYAGDLKVHPKSRGSNAADALTQWGFLRLSEMGPADRPTLLTILENNRPMERRTGGRGGVPRCIRFATIRAYSIPLFWSFQRGMPAGVRIHAAADEDLEEMAEFWSKVAPQRQFAPAFDAAQLCDWIRSAPGLSISDYRIARAQNGRILGFLAWWDQTVFKQTRIVRLPHSLQRVRTMINALARLHLVPPLSADGGVLRQCTALHLCVPYETPAILGALLKSGAAELRRQQYCLATIGLDAIDPLCAAVKGHWSQPVMINAYVSTTGGVYQGPPLEARPLYYDLSLV